MSRAVSAATVERQQFDERVVVGDVDRPAVGGSNGGIENRVRIGEPLRSGVVEVRQRARFERGCGGLVARHRTCRIAGNRLVQPLDPFGRIEPPVAQLDQPLSCVRDGGGARVVCIVGGGGVRRQPVGERKRLEGGGRGVARVVAFAEPRTEPERPHLVEPAVQDAEGRVVVARDDDQLMVGTDARVAPDTTQEEHGKTDQLLLKAKRQYQAACRGEDRLRKDMLDDRRFRLGRLGDESFQWPENVYIQRKQEHRAVLQTNRMPAFVALARNAVLSANIRPHVQPVDDKADVKTAEVLGALIRNTEHLSQVEAVYTTAIDSMAENGRGYVQVVKFSDRCPDLHDHPVTGARCCEA